MIDSETSDKIFKRTGEVIQIQAYINSLHLK